jgi:hypothetical protein
MRAAFLARAVLAGAAGLLLAGCSPPPPSATAACFVNSASAEQLFSAGRHPASLTQDACLGGNLVEGVLAVFGTGEEYKAKVRKEFAALAKDDLSVRAGQYAVLADAQGPLPLPASRAAGELGLFMEEVAVTRAGALACGIVSAPELELVGQLDSLFSLAVSGVRIGMPDLGGARDFTDQLLKRALDQAVERTPAEPVCDVALETRLKGHLAQWQEFYAGAHPWAPGCTATVNEKEFALKCI